ncbi:hypothetical protein [Sphingobacterium hungaricum]|uniref:Uncharacterized protein n=1 Tax=Sphingobacterium hungaricum TaxID=2082723 RepID=A0A928UXN5_9SPHI|nr:hypothetical protein [Sphingobacterium hungaricum]MBE8712682.1 hypothetical protein [Sphingobacterium hungaricum]
MEFKMLHQKEKNWVVNSLSMSLVMILLLSACQSTKRYLNSRGYEIIHHNQDKSVQHVPLLVHGKITISETGKKVAFATLRFESNKGKVYNAKADKSGFYSIKFDKEYFEGNVDVEGNGSSFTVEDIFFGYSDASEFNIMLYNYDKPGNFVVLNKNDIISIRERSAKGDSLKIELK